MKRSLVLGFLAIGWVAGCAMAPPDPYIFPERPARVQYEEDPAAYIDVDAPLVALVGAKVFDGLGSPALLNQTLLLHEGYIEVVGAADEVPVPDSAFVIDMAGRTVIPGIVGMHNHMHMPGIHFIGYSGPRLYLASGVTTIQTTGSASPDAEAELARDIEAGLAAGPDIVHTGPYFSGEGGSPAMINPEGEAHVRELMQHWTEKEVTWLKAYRHIAPADLQLLINIAHEYGAKVTGHLCTVTYKEAAAMGIDAIEHGFIHSYDHAEGKEAGKCSGSRDFRSNLPLDSEAIREVHQTLIEHGVALTSTLAIFEAQVPSRAYADDRTFAAMSPRWLENYEVRRRRMDATGANWYFKEDWLVRSMAYDLAFFRAGGLLTAGLDPGLHNLPGFGDQRNFELFIEAGFSVAEAIQVMTSNGAAVLEYPDIGRIQPGFRANLVVIDGNLEADASHIRDVAWVFKDGYGFSPGRLLADVQGVVGDR